MNTNSGCNKQVLGFESSGLSVVPINCNRHRKFIYRIYLKSLDSAAITDVCMRYLKQEFMALRGTLYLADFDDYKQALNLFEKHITQVAGPVTEHHLDVLLGNYMCVVRPRNWYHQYDARVELFSYRERSNVFHHQVSDLVGNIEHPYKVVALGFRSAAVYTMMPQAELMTALCKVTYPDKTIRTYVSRCVVWNNKSP